MLCKFCQENVRGTPCQTASQASKCVNNRDVDWPEDRMESKGNCERQCMKEKKDKNS